MAFWLQILEQTSAAYFVQIVTITTTIMTDETKILGRCEFMKYNNDELKIINEWLTSLAVQHLVDEDFF